MKLKKRSISMKVLLTVLSLFLICVTCKADRAELEQNAITAYAAVINAYKQCIFYKGEGATVEYIHRYLHGNRDVFVNNEGAWYYLIVTNQREFRYRNYDDNQLKTFTYKLSLIKTEYELFYQEIKRKYEDNEAYEKHMFFQANSAADSDHWTKSKHQVPLQNYSF